MMTTEQVKRCDVCRKFTEPVEEFVAIIKRTYPIDVQTPPQKTVFASSAKDLCPRHLGRLMRSIDRALEPLVGTDKTE